MAKQETNQGDGAVAQAADADAERAALERIAAQMAADRASMEQAATRMGAEREAAERAAERMSADRWAAEQALERAGGLVAGARGGPVMAVTSEDVRRAGEAEMFLRQHATRDDAREMAGDVVVIAVVGFTIHDDPLLENGRIVQPGEELTISRYDLERTFLGKVRLRDLPDTPGAPIAHNGVTIT